MSLNKSLLKDTKSRFQEFIEQGEQTWNHESSSGKWTCSMNQSSANFFTYASLDIANLLNIVEELDSKLSEAVSLLEYAQETLGSVHLEDAEISKFLYGEEA